MKRLWAGTKLILSRHRETLGWIAGGSYVVIATQFVAAVILARLIDPHHFGVYGIGLAAFMIIAKIQEAGFDEAVLNAQASDDSWLAAHRAHSVRAGIATAMIGIVISGVIFIAGVEEAWPTLAALSATAVVGGRFRTYQVALRQAQRWGDLMKTSIAANILGCGLAITLAAFGLQVTALTLGMGCTLVVGPILARFAWGSHVPIGRDDEVKQQVWDYGPAPRWAFSSMSQGVLYQFDNITIGLIGGPAALGLYSKSFNLASLPTTQLGNLLTNFAQPKFAAIKRDPSGLGRLYKRLFEVVTTLSFSCGFFLFVFAEPIVTTLYGNRWRGAADSLRALALYAAFRPVQDDLYSVLVVTGYTHWPIRVSTIQSVLLLGLSVPMMLIGGPVAVALALGGASVVGVLVLLAVARGAQLPSPVASLFIKVLATVGAAIGVVLLVDASAVGSRLLAAAVLVGWIAVLGAPVIRAVVGEGEAEPKPSAKT